MNKTEFDATINSPEYTMKCNGCAVGLNMPVALKSRGAGADEVAQGLPPFRPRRAFLVDEYPACPDNWPRSTGRTKSYFVPVLPDHGLWLDFRSTLKDIPQHVAIIPSIQGINALTGMPTEDSALEQYRDKCPRHKKAFGPDRLCSDCGFKWPMQNYMSSAATSASSLWLDGFRSQDGDVRQYVFTENEARGVAKAILGDKRVFAIGVAYYLSRTMRPAPAPVSRGYHGMDMMVDMASGPDQIGSCDITYTASTSPPSWGGILRSSGVRLRSRISGQQVNSVSRRAPEPTAFVSQSLKELDTTRVAVKTMEVAAGAKIRQRIDTDSNDLSFWCNEPHAIIVVNYCSEQDCQKIIEAGKFDVGGSAEGFMQKIPVGN